MRCNCESLVCKMPHADGSRDTLDTRAWKPCPNDALDDFRILYIGPVCEGCYRSFPAEYRMARNPSDWWGGDKEHAIDDLWIYIDNTRELYDLKKRVLADPRAYDARLAPYLWIEWVNLGAAMYVHELILGKPLSTFYRQSPAQDVVQQYIPLAIREELALQIAKHERQRLIHEQEYAPPPDFPGRSPNPRRVIRGKGGVLRLVPDCADGELQRIVSSAWAGHGQTQFGATTPVGAYALGSTRIWYARTEFFGDGNMGVEWLKKKNLMPDPAALEKTHVCIGRVAETYLEAIFGMMQGENWSPHGEARGFISSRGLQHTSMSVGDIVQKGGRFYIVDRAGFVEFT